MVRSFSIVFAAISLCVASVRSFAARVTDAVAAVALRVVEFIGSQFASSPRIAFDGPAALLDAGSSWRAPLVDRHEAGTSRRSAARNV